MTYKVFYVRIRQLNQFKAISYILEIKKLIVGMFFLIGVIKKPK